MIAYITSNYINMHEATKRGPGYSTVRFQINDQELQPPKYQNDDLDHHPRTGQCL